MKAREMEWKKSWDGMGWTLKRERQRAFQGCLRWESIGEIFREPVNRCWVWTVKVEGPITGIIGRTKTIKAAKLAVETTLRVLEAKPRKPRRKPELSYAQLQAAAERARSVGGLWDSKA